jgi:sporulation protein, YlmC/YmxH family
MNNVEYTFCGLREKEVVNTVDGKRLGRIADIAFTCRGQIYGIIVPGNTRLLKSITGGDALFIPWRNICKIGEDVILVELTAQQAKILEENAVAE